MDNEIAFYVFRALSGIGGALVASSNIGESVLRSIRAGSYWIVMLASGIVAENTGPGRLRSLSIGLCISGLPLGGAVGFASAAPLAAATT